MKAYEKFLYKLGLIRVDRFKKFISSILLASATIHSDDMNEIRKLKIDNAIWRAEAKKVNEESNAKNPPEKEANKKRSKSSK